MIDYIGGKHLGIRRSTRGVAISQLAVQNGMMDMSPDEWDELVELVIAINKASDWRIHVNGR